MHPLPFLDRDANRNVKSKKVKNKIFKKSKILHYPFSRMNPHFLAHFFQELHDGMNTPDACMGNEGMHTLTNLKGKYNKAPYPSE